MKLKLISGCLLAITSIASITQVVASPVQQTSQQREQKAKPQANPGRSTQNSSGSTSQVKRVPESKPNNKAVIKPGS